MSEDQTDSNAELLWPFQCQRCRNRQILSFGGLNPDRFQVRHRCSQCNYINILEQFVTKLPLRQVWAAFPPDLQKKFPRSFASTASQDAYPELLRRTAQASVETAARLVSANPEGACAAMVLGLRERESVLREVIDSAGTGH